MQLPQVVVSTSCGIVACFAAVALPVAGRHIWALGVFTGPLVCLAVCCCRCRHC